MGYTAKITKECDERNECSNGTEYDMEQSSGKYISSLTNETEYTVQVAAYNEAGMGPFSEPTSFETPDSKLV